MKDGDGRKLLTTVLDELSARWPFHKVYHADLPPGLRLELSPLASNHLLTDPSLNWQYGKQADPHIKQLSDMFGIPVHIMTAMEPGTWRLVIVTEDVLNGGRL